MFRVLSLSAVLLATAAPAFAQRAEENAVKSADDAFGTSVGNEKIGLYSANDVRGFSPITAGNVRVDGLAVTEHGGFNTRVIASSTIRVGLTAQGYPFPAPTGIADFALRNAGNDLLVSTGVYLGPEGTKAIDLDTQLPVIRDRLGIAAGAAFRYEENFPGEDGKQASIGTVARWRPAGSVEIKPFFGYSWGWDDRDLPSVFTAGPYLPPKIERRNFGLDWVTSESRRYFGGTVANVQASDNWQVRAGLFRWDNRSPRAMTELYRNVGADGVGDRSVVAGANGRAASTSGELRSSSSLIEGDRRHTLHLSARGRDTRRWYGGSDDIALGKATIGERAPVDEIAAEIDPQNRDHVRQMTGSLGYELRWPGVGELSLGVQKTGYRKDTRVPGQPVLTTRDSPWLYNGTLAVQLARPLVVYVGYTRGLEESGSAPQNAVNRSEAPPALRTSQRDAGLRYAILPTLSFVAGVFDVRKPYFNLDPDRVFRNLGTVRHRGVELSLAGQPLRGLSLVAGAVFLDADVTGEAVDLGVIGPKPVGTTVRNLRANLDYRLPFADALSFDLGIANLGPRIASARTYAELGGEQLTTKARTIVDVGARYRFKLGSAPATLRAQVTNLFDVHEWDVSSNSAFRPIDPRRVMLNLAADF